MMRHPLIARAANTLAVLIVVALFLAFWIVTP